MSESSEMWRDIKSERQTKKQSNIKSSIKLLEQNGIQFSSSNNVHYIISVNGMPVIDYWPSTGLFINRKTRNKDRGIRSLIRMVNDLKTKGGNTHE